MENGHSQKEPKLVFKTIYRLMQVKSIAECSPWSILQYFRPSLSYHLPLRSLFCLFLNGRFTQVLLYCLSYVLGAQKNRLIEKVLLSTRNICLGLEIHVRKITFNYALLSGDLKVIH